MNPLIAAVAVPSVLIILGMFFNWQEARSIRAEMRDGFSDVNSRFESIRSELVTMQSDMRQFYHLTGKA